MWTRPSFIPGLEDYKAPVFLRPRRFGKSLLVSLLLTCYYDRTKADRFEELFGGTWIGEHPTEEHNRYMIVRYDFSKMVMADDMEGLERNFNRSESLSRGDHGDAQPGLVPRTSSSTSKAEASQDA